MSDALPFRWGQQFRIPRREEGIGGRKHFTSDFPELPANMDGVPFPVWGSVPDPSSDDSVVAAQHISQFVWIKVGVSLLVGERAVVPLIDTNNVPYVDPGFPPHVVAMIDDGGVGVGAGEYDDLQDPNGNWRSGMGIRSNRDLDRKNMLHWFLRRSNDPVPHWILEVHFGYHDTTGDVPSARVCTLDINFLTTRVGPPASNTRTYNPVPNTNDAAAKIFNLWPGNTDVDHGGAPALTGINEMTMVIGAHDQSSTNAFHYLTDDGTSTGASLFDTTVRPACVVFGDIRHDGFTAGDLRAGLDPWNWRPGTHGLGYLDNFWATPFTLDSGQQITWPSGANPEDEVNFFMDFVLMYHSASGRWRISTFKATGVPSATDRTHYFMLYGLKP